MSRQARLAARVKAANRAFAYALELHAQLLPIFKPLVGKQILKKEGNLLAKVEKLIPELPHIGSPSYGGDSIQAFQRRSEFSLDYEISSCELIDESSCLYHKTNICIGEITKGVLTSVHENAPNYRTDYTVEEVEQNRAAVRAAQEELSSAQAAVWPFDMHDYG